MLARLQTNTLRNGSAFPLGSYPPAHSIPPKAVLLVSDSPFTLENLDRGLAAVDSLALAGACGWRDVVERTSWWCPDIVVLDALVTPLDGLFTTVQRLRSLTDPPLIVLLVHREVDQQRIDCVDAAFALDLGLEPVLEGLQLLASGVLLPASTARTPARPGDSAMRTRLATLTDREREVLTLIVEGLSNREVGVRLFISPDTVKEHVSRILAKLEVASRIEAAVAVVRAEMEH